jgi:hypothetical protein
MKKLFIRKQDEFSAELRILQVISIGDIQFL